MRPDYSALEDHLRRLPVATNQVTLTFAEIEHIVGAPLPASHLDHQAWWANQSDTTNRVQARAWTNAGFRVDSAEQSRGGGVIFERV